MPLTNDLAELEGWLRLAHTDGIGAVRSGKLRGRFSTATAILNAGVNEVADAAESAAAAHALFAPDPIRDQAIARALDWARASDCHLIGLSDPRYPPVLAQTPAAAPLLYVRGDPAALVRPTLAIVGARSASAGGRTNARAFAAALAARGWSIASGLARGIDAAAHDGALDVDGCTVAVVGTGADIVYPPEHAGLAQRLLDAGGAIVSELPLGMLALPSNFPRRNRLIAGLSAGVLVVEAAIHSGSLSTAKHAAEANREVFAIPGSIHSPLARGCHRLIRDGAKLVETVDDVIEELRNHASAATFAPRQCGDGERGDSPVVATDDPLLAAVGFDPALPETVATRAGVGLGDALARLLELELRGAIERMSDGRIVRRFYVG